MTYISTHVLYTLLFLPFVSPSVPLLLPLSTASSPPFLRFFSSSHPFSSTSPPLLHFFLPLHLTPSPHLISYSPVLVSL